MHVLHIFGRLDRAGRWEVICLFVGSVTKNMAGSKKGYAGPSWGMLGL